MKTKESRSGIDRRQGDFGPPGKLPERRRRPERRLPELTEISDISFEGVPVAAGWFRQVGFQVTFQLHSLKNGTTSRVSCSDWRWVSGANDANRVENGVESSPAANT
jgi:hypothetical protein